MHINHHPDQFLLADYAAGSIPSALALPIAVHLEFCSRCRGDQRELAELGAGLFETLDPVPVGDDALEQVLQQLEHEPAAPTTCPRQPDSLPRALSSLVPQGVAQLDWERQGRVLKVARLAFGDQDREVALHHIRAGGRVPEHGHRGREFTVVLRGAFSDADGDYCQGDFALRTPGEVHRPVAWQSADCLCLSVQEGPIRFEGMFSRLLNPFIKLQAH